jgi:hypothetical protein
MKSKVCTVLYSALKIKFVTRKSQIYQAFVKQAKQDWVVTPAGSHAPP